MSQESDGVSGIRGVKRKRTRRRQRFDGGRCLGRGRDVEEAAGFYTVVAGVEVFFSG
jgi:hypothetical protein